MIPNKDLLDEQEELTPLIEDTPNIIVFTISMIFISSSLFVMLISGDINILSMILFWTGVILHIVNLGYYIIKYHERRRKKNY